MQFKNRFLLRGIITGASTPTPSFARTKQVSREAPFETGPRKKHRIRPSELAGRVPGRQSKPPAASSNLKVSPQWCFHTQ